MPVVSSAGAVAAANAAIAANNMRLFGTQISDGGIVICAFFITLLSVAFGFMAWDMRGCMTDTICEKIAFWILFSVVFLCALSFPVALVMWLCGVEIG